MANTFDGQRWRIDTPGSGMLASGYLYVKSIKWVGNGVVGSGGAPHAVIQDSLGNTIWESYAAAANFDITQSWENHWFNGFKVTTLDGGVLQLDYK
jgi:hypothetical protein